MSKKNTKIITAILKLKKEKKALLLAHNYQRPEIQNVADYVGDSIELCKKAREEENSKLIVFSAVDFMAESAALLNPKRTVLLPTLGARCPMAQMLPREQVRLWKKKYPNVPVVLYVNTLAEAKAECNVCCTSANAVQIVNALDADTVLFGPDRNLAWHVEQKTGKKVIPIPAKGFCPTHLLFLKEEILVLKQKHPDAVVMVHPECSPEVQQTADFVGSTSQMCRYVKESADKKFIVGTETGLIHRLKKENPEKKFLPAYEGGVCPNMKLNTLELLYQALKKEQHIVTIPKNVAEKARKALQKMFELTA